MSTLEEQFYIAIMWLLVVLAVIVPVCLEWYECEKLKFEYKTALEAFKFGYSAIQLQGSTEWVWQNKSAEKVDLGSTEEQLTTIAKSSAALQASPHC